MVIRGNRVFIGFLLVSFVAVVIFGFVFVEYWNDRWTTMKKRVGELQAEAQSLAKPGQPRQRWGSQGSERHSGWRRSLRQSHDPHDHAELDPIGSKSSRNSRAFTAYPCRCRISQQWELGWDGRPVVNSLASIAELGQNQNLERGKRREGWWRSWRMAEFIRSVGLGHRVRDRKVVSARCIAGFLKSEEWWQKAFSCSLSPIVGTAQP